MIFMMNELVMEVTNALPDTATFKDVVHIIAVVHHKQNMQEKIRFIKNIINN